jgi:hypothetical protein
MSKLQYDFPRKLLAQFWAKAAPRSKRSSKRAAHASRCRRATHPTPNRSSFQAHLIKCCGHCANQRSLWHGACLAWRKCTCCCCCCCCTCACCISVQQCGCNRRTKPAPAQKQHKNKVATDAIGDGDVLRLYVPESSFGALIGPKGESVRQLEANTGAKIKIPRDNDAERAVRVLGDKKQIAAARCCDRAYHWICSRPPSPLSRVPSAFLPVRSAS